MTAKRTASETSTLGNVSHPQLEAVTPADYYRNDPIPTPSVFQIEGIDYCTHDHRKGNCRHKECPHYAPHEALLSNNGLEVDTGTLPNLGEGKEK